MVLLLLLASIALGAASGGRSFYFSTTHDISAVPPPDFRGCFEGVCVYVSPQPVVPSRRVAFDNQTVWLRKNWGAAVEFIVGQEKPREGTQLNVRVPSRRVVPSTFSAASRSGEANPAILKLLSYVSETQLKARVATLSDYFTRNSLSQDAVKVADDLELELERLGCVDVESQPFRTNYSPNIYCTVPGADETLPIVVIGAHYDSRSTGLTDPKQRAPGADDNGSGTAAVLHLLDIIHTNGFKFRRNIVFAFFSGEEQGLYGSDAMSLAFKNNGVKIEAMINIDMIGYPQKNAPSTIYWMSGGTNKALTNLAIELSKTYLSAQGTVVSTTSACCTDSQSFNADGFPSASIFESLGAGNNPNYHRSTDLPDTVTFSHVKACASAAYILAATVAEIHNI